TVVRKGTIAVRGRKADRGAAGIHPQARRPDIRIEAAARQLSPEAVQLDGARISLRRFKSTRRGKTHPLLASAPRLFLMFEHLLGDECRGHRGWPSGVKGHVGDDLGYLGAGHA